MSNRFAVFDADRVLQFYLTVTDQAELARNVPRGGGSVRSDDIDEPRSVRFDLANKPIPIAATPETAEQALVRMLATIDGEREVKMMTTLTDGGAKKYEYAEKSREVRDYRTLGGSATAGLLLPLNVAGTRDRFGWAMAEVDDTGDSIETVITRYEAAMRRDLLTRKVAARAQKLKRQIRAAAPSARAAIFNARAWPTS
jgi:hypothetical protein